MQNLLHKLKSDESLMLAYQRGDSSAFDVLYCRHKDLLFNFLFNSCQCYSVVEELAHDTWLSIIRNIKSYKVSASFKSYLYKVARNRLIDHWRKREDHKDILFDEDSHPAMEVSETDQQSNLQIKVLMDAIATLPEDQREALLLRQEGFSRQEIADITGANPETIKSRIRYARQSLQAIIEGQS